MSGWRIVPAEASDKQLENARDWSYVKYGQSIGNDAANGCWRCMVAAAPEPDWEALARAVVAEYETHNWPAPSIALMLLSLKAAFGSKP